MSLPRSAASTRRILGGILLAGLLLRLRGLGSLFIDADEYFQIYTALKSSSLAAFLSLLRNNPHHVLLDPLSTYLVSRLTDSLAWLRLPSALLSAAAPYLLFRIGRRLAGERVALASAALLAVSMLHIEWARRVDFYAALVFWTLLSVDSLLAAVEDPRPRRLLAYGLGMAGFGLTHPYALLVGGIELVWLAVAAPRVLARAGGALAAAAAACLPWHLYATGGLIGSRKFYYTEAVGLWHPRGDIIRCLTGWAQTPERAARYATGPYAVLVGAAALVYLLLAVLGAARVRGQKERAAGWSLAAFFIPAGLAGIWGLDVGFSYYFSIRQTLFILPFYLLFAAKGLAAVHEAVGPTRRAAVLPAVLALLFLGAYVADGRYDALCGRLMDGFIEDARREVRPGDILLFTDPNTAQAFLYRYDRRAFLSVDPPALSPKQYLGAYLFRLPKELWADNGAVRSRVFSIIDPWASPEEEVEQWKAIGRAMVGVRTLFVHLPGKAGTAFGKVDEFRAVVAAVDAETARGAP